MTLREELIINDYTRSRAGSKGLRGNKKFPFGDAAWLYRELGWTGTIPVTRRGTKAPLAKGVTGHAGIDPDYDQLESLIAEFPSANIGLRLPWDIVGIDVDAYDDRAGKQTLESLTMKLGSLPPTWRSTSREDGVSGIYLFSARRNMKQVWVTDLGAGSGIEIAQFHHRFATVWPSIHNSTGKQYFWRYGDVVDGIPSPEDLPMLPVPWGLYLLSRREYIVKSSAASAEVMSWYKRVAGGAMCKWMTGASDIEATKLIVAGKSGGLHDALITGVTYLCTNASEGHRGLDVALSVVEEAFINSGRRRNLRSEWTGAVNTAMAKAAALQQEETDVCSLTVADWRRRS
jgi:hypothetical protein